MNDKMKKKKTPDYKPNRAESKKKNERCYHMHKFQIIKLALIVAIIKEKIRVIFAESVSIIFYIHC